MSKHTAMQRHIKWLEKKLSECQPMAPGIPFINMAINNAKGEIISEKQQLQNAYISGSKQGYADGAYSALGIAKKIKTADQDFTDYFTKEFK